MRTPVNQLTRMHDAHNLAILIAQETAPTMQDERYALKLAHRHYCTLNELQVEYNLARDEDEAISRIYLKLAQGEREASPETKRKTAKLESNTKYGKFDEKEI